MNQKITLTGGRKMMNIAKLGIVSRVGNYFHSLGKRYKQRAGGLMAYTLCVFQGWAKRNGSRHSFAFDIPLISGFSLTRLADCRAQVRARQSGKLVKVAALVPLQLILISESHGHETQTPSKSFWLWLTGRFLGVKNYSGSRYGYGHHVTPTKSGFSLAMGGCHE